LQAPPLVHGATSDPLGEDWQRQRLFDPTERQLQQDQKGQIFVYVGLTDRNVLQAMDEHVDRVESMMSANTIVTAESGEPNRDEATRSVVMEDDGC
jgi:hypothetical protein